MVFLGFSAGLPLYLVFSSLSLWLREAGVDRATVTYFSWAVLGYSFKFVWAPLVDRLPVPILTRSLGRRRGWLLLAQLGVIASILMMAGTDPQYNLSMMAVAAVLLGFSSATQDIVVDAYRIEAAVPRLQAMLASTYVAGYRTGMIVAGAGALYLAEGLGSTKELYNYEAWRLSYMIMASVMGIGIATTLLISEPEVSREVQDGYPAHDYLRFFLVFLLSIATFATALAVIPSSPQLFAGGWQGLFGFVYGALSLVGALLLAYGVARGTARLGLVNMEMVRQGYQAPLLDFLERYGKVALWVLLLVGFYRVSDIVMGVIANVFYQDMGYTKEQIASVTKVFGVVVTITGSFLGGLLALRIGVMRVLMLGAVLVAVTNLLFMWLANTEPHIVSLTLVIIADNLAQGVAIAAFIAWLSALTNVSFTATQYAIFSSLMTLLPKVMGGFSGTIVNAIGYTQFFLFASLLGVPVIALIYFLRDKMEFED
ncbi:MAG: MFS transporter [Gammaproteobacteria bacterium]|nr:MFS transporter [Gammaproteobacteria bacterium]